MGISSFVQLGNGWTGIYQSRMADGNTLSRSAGTRRAGHCSLRHDHPVWRH